MPPHASIKPSSIKIYNTNPATAAAAAINPPGANMFPALPVVFGEAVVVCEPVGVEVESAWVAVFDAVPVLEPEAVVVGVTTGSEEVLSPPAETHQEVTMD